MHLNVRNVFQNIIIESYNPMSPKTLSKL